MTWEENQYLIHYGIKGQKHGQRRFQNEDGTLTAEGKDRYANKKEYSGKDDRVLRTLAKSSWYGRKTAANYVANKGQKKADDLKAKASAMRKSASKIAEDDPLGAQKLLSKADKYEKGANSFTEHAKAQKKANADRKQYEDHTSTKKLVMQDLLLSKHGAQNYRAARARGTGRGRAFLESTAGIGLLGTVLAAKGNKKKYGKHVILSAPKDHEYDASAMDRD